MWLAKNEFKLDYWLGNPFGEGINPPGITLFVYSFSVIFFLYFLFVLMETSRYGAVKKIYKWTASIGQFSLYIFLYHRLVLDYFLTHINITNIWMKRVTYIFCMLYFPILLKVIISKVYNKIYVKNN